MFVSQRSLNVRQISTHLFLRGGYHKRRRLMEEEAEVGATMALTAYGRPLTVVFPSKCLVRVV